MPRWRKLKDNLIGDKQQRIEKRPLTRNNRQETENGSPETRVETTGEPVETDIIPPRSHRPKASPESRSRTPETSSHHPEEERPGISTPHLRPSLRVNVTSEGVREIIANEDRVIPPTSTTPKSTVQDVPLTTWTSLSDHERILGRTRE